MPDRNYMMGVSGNMEQNQPENDLSQALFELQQLVSGGEGQLAEQASANLGKERSAIGSAFEQYDKPESKFNRLADPIQNILTSIAYIADISSKRPGRRRNAGAKFANMIGGVEAGKAARQTSKQRGLSETLQKIGIESGLDKEALDILMKKHQEDVAVQKAKVQVAEGTAERASRTRNTQIASGGKGPSPDEVFTGNALNLFHATNDPESFRRKYPGLYSHLVAKKEIAPIEEEDDALENKAMDSFIKHAIENPDMYQSDDDFAGALERVFDILNIHREEKNKRKYPFGQAPGNYGLKLMNTGLGPRR